MGKNLVITGADFYDNALERAVEWEDITSIFSSWVAGGWKPDGTYNASGVFQRTSKVDISTYAGKKIKFLNVAWTASDGTISGFAGAVVFGSDDSVLQSVAFPINGAASSGYAFEEQITLSSSASKIAFTYFTDVKAEALQQPSFYCFVEE